MEGMDGSGRRREIIWTRGPRKGLRKVEGGGMEPNVWGRSSRALNARLKTLDYRPEKARRHSFIHSSAHPSPNKYLLSP